MHQWPSQDDVLSVKEAFRLIVSVGGSSVATSSSRRRKFFNANDILPSLLMLELPRTSTEEFLDIPASSMSLPAVDEETADSSADKDIEGCHDHQLSV